MKVAVLGTGYVGLSTGVCLAEIGHQVTCIDTDPLKIEKLQQGISPIYEPGLEELLLKNGKEGRIHFTTSHSKGLEKAELIMIAVGTPQKEDGSADLAFIEQAAKDIATHLKHDAIVIVKSTVPVGTNDYVKQLLKQHGNANIKMEVVSNPEFLRQGSAIMDTLKPDRIIIGSDKEETAKVVDRLYAPLQAPVLITSIRSAELIKYASNAFLAMKISYINEMAHLCEAVSANVMDVARGMGMDHRIGESFLRAGIGYGGSCFPKDVKALLHTANSNGVAFSLLKETIAINEQQKNRFVEKVINRFGDLHGKKIAMFGLAFKPETDDMREAPSIPIARSLTSLGANVCAYDPVAKQNARKILGDIIFYADSALEAAKDADAILIVTEWEEFQNLDFCQLFNTMRQPIIFDGRNCLQREKIKPYKLAEYYPIGT